MKSESFHSSNNSPENSARGNLLASALVLSLAMFPRDADAQTQSPERFEDIPHIELETAEAGSYQTHLNNLTNQAALAISLIQTIETGINDNTIVTQEHIDNLKDQLNILKTNINNIQLMAIAAAPSEGKQLQEILDDLGPTVVPTLSAILAIEEILTELEKELV